MSVSTRLARPVDLDDALHVWSEANLARSKVPSQERFARVRTKLVFVHPSYWGKGNGQHLLTSVATYAAKQGYSLLQLWTGQSNERAQRLYRRSGFELSSRTQKLDSGEMVLHLTRPVTA